MVPAGAGQVDGRAGAHPAAAVVEHAGHVAATAVVQAQQHVIAQGDDLGTKGVGGGQVHPGGQGDVDRVAEPAGHFHIARAGHADHVAARAVDDGGDTAHGAGVASGGAGIGAQRTGILEGVTALQAGVDIERNEQVVTRGDGQCRATIVVCARRVTESVECSVDAGYGAA